MEMKWHYDFAVNQIKWYEQQNDFCTDQIAWCNRQLKRERENDRELARYALESEPDDPLTVKIFGGKYIGTETRKLINERAKYYREIKKNTARIEHYRKEAEQFSKYI